ncbi:unnamed protein product [Soboliphyme baturini]|uniref:Uncharacterized protein n=1 Tax=Soboliphyme baturini TaxID=241478 RepID=A0A183JAJ6_9BILA|nr:unnamed protein product [Soboliphyme baturini]
MILGHFAFAPFAKKLLASVPPPPQRSEHPQRLLKGQRSSSPSSSCASDVVNRLLCLTDDQPNLAMNRQQWHSMFFYAGLPPISYKISTEVLTNTIQEKLNAAQPKEREEFITQLSKTDHPRMVQ